MNVSPASKKEVTHQEKSDKRSQGSRIAKSKKKSQFTLLKFCIFIGHEGEGVVKWRITQQHLPKLEQIIEFRSLRYCVTLK